MGFRILTFDRFKFYTKRGKVAEISKVFFCPSPLTADHPASMVQAVDQGPQRKERRASRNG
jgi:hypothetical protein